MLPDRTAEWALLSPSRHEYHHLGGSTCLEHSSASFCPSRTCSFSAGISMPCNVWSRPNSIFMTTAGRCAFAERKERWDDDICTTRARPTGIRQAWSLCPLVPIDLVLRSVPSMYPDFLGCTRRQLLEECNMCTYLHRPRGLCFPGIHQSLWRCSPEQEPGQRSYAGQCDGSEVKIARIFFLFPHGHLSNSCPWRDVCSRARGVRVCTLKYDEAETHQQTVDEWLLLLRAR